MFKDCRASELTVGMMVVARTGEIWEVTKVVVGRVQSRYGMVTVEMTPLVTGMTGARGPTGLQARPRDVFTIAEFAN